MSDDKRLTTPDYSVNRPGQSTIFYRATTHGQSLLRMKTRLAKQSIASGPHQGSTPLAALTTLADHEPVVALLSAWSATLDVLTFYQERFANETYLRTATESFSLRCLSQGIGYRPQPALSASTYLAFTLDDSASMPTQVTIPAQTQVMSVPSGSKLPQFYETTSELTARVGLNQLVPRLVVPQTLLASNQASAGSVVTTLYLDGQSTGLAVGSLVRLGNASTLQVTALRRDQSQLLTEVTFQVLDGPSVRLASAASLPSGDPSSLPRVLSESVVREHIVGRLWDHTTLLSALAERGWDAQVVEQLTASVLADRSTASVLAYRQQCSCFCAGAVPWSSLPKVDSTYLRGTDLYADSSSSWDETASSSSTVTRNRRSVWEDSWGQLYSATTSSDLFLDRTATELVAGSSILLAGSVGYRSYTVGSVSHTTVRGYGTTARSTGIKLGVTSGALAAAQSVKFLVRDTSVYLQSEELALCATVAVTDDSPVRDSLELSGLQLGLRAGQPLLVTGEHADQSGVTSREIAILAQVVHRGGYTSLYFAEPLKAERKRSTVSICANVTIATHGKTVATEVLGSGDAGLCNQRFVLKEGPLTYLPSASASASASASGIRSTLKVRVGGVLWQEVDSLLTQDGRSRCYVLECSDSGQVSVVFGDGTYGARLPSGQDNVVASYRVGSGLDGELAAESLAVLLSRPLGLRSVSQPLPASGAAAAVSADALRSELPLSVATLGRAVSLLDHERMAQSYPGIAKAQATSVRLAGAVGVHLTVATDDGEPLDQSSALYQGLRTTLQSLGDPTQPLLLDDYQPQAFRLKLRISVDPRFDPPAVCVAVRTQLAQTFSFAARGFAQSVRAAEVLDVVQSVPGVQGALLDALYLAGDSPSRRLLLPATPAWIDRTGRSAGAEILILELDDDSVGVLS